MLGSTTDASIRAISLAGEVLEATSGTVLAIDGALDEVSDGLRTTQQSVADAAITLTQLSALTSDLGELVGDDVPASLDAVQASLVPIERTAGLLDGALRALSFLGVDYDPETPLDDAIDELETRLDEIPARLRAQAPVIDSAADSLSEFGRDTLVIAEDLNGIRSRLADTGVAVATYRSTALEAQSLLDAVEEGVSGRLDVLRLAVVLVGVGLAASQTVPIVLGLWFLSSEGRNPVARVESGGDSIDRTDTGE